MGNRRFKLLINAETIYNNLLPEQKERFNNIEIIGATVEHSCAYGSGVEIECLAFEDEITERNARQVVLLEIEGGYIDIDDI